jgi:hypothetical protein
MKTISSDGACRNMRGELLLASNNAPLHLVVEAALAAGVTVVAIADGGNELGMGALCVPNAHALPHKSTAIQ